MSQRPCFRHGAQVHVAVAEILGQGGVLCEARASPHRSVIHARVILRYVEVDPSGLRLAFVEIGSSICYANSAPIVPARAESAQLYFADKVELLNPSQCET